MTKDMIRGADRILWTEKGKAPQRKPVGVKFNLLLLFTLLMLFIIGGSLFHVWSRIQLIQLGYEISNTLKEGRVLAEANKKLRLEIATLKSYGRIEKIAVEELGMIKPRPDQVIVIR
jgi:cell division protein FtsL